MSSKLRPDAKEWAPPGAAVPSVAAAPTSGGYAPRGPRGTRFNTSVPEFTPSYFPPQYYPPQYNYNQYYGNEYGYANSYGPYSQPYQQNYSQNYTPASASAYTEPPKEEVKDIAPATKEAKVESKDTKIETKEPKVEPKETILEPKETKVEPTEEPKEEKPKDVMPEATPTTQEPAPQKPALVVTPPSDGSEWKQKATLPSPTPPPGNEEWKRGMVSAEKTCAQMMMRKDGVIRYDKLTLQQLFTRQPCDDEVKKFYGSLCFLRAPAVGVGGVGYLHPDVSIVFSQENLSREDTFKHDPNRLVDDTNPNTMFNKAKLILNQLTITNYDKLSNKFISLPIFQTPLPAPTEPVEGQMQSVDVLVKLINELVMKAQLEEKFCYMYANLAKVIIETTAVGADFKNLLLIRCEEEFKIDRQATIDNILALDLPADEKEEKMLVAKLRYLGHMRLIGELYLLDLIRAKIMNYCLNELLMDPTEIATSDDEERYVCVCKLLSTIGYKLERYEMKKHKSTPTMNGYFETMSRLSKEETTSGGTPLVSSRIRCLFMDLIEMRQKGWKERRTEERMMVVGGGSTPASTPKGGLKPSGSDDWTEVKGQKKSKVTIKTPTFGRGVQDARVMSGAAPRTVIKKPPTPKTPAASKPTTGVAAPAASILDADGHVQEAAMRKVVSLLEEFFITGELAETMEAIQNLVPSKEYVPFLSRVLKHSMDLKEKQRGLLVDVISTLIQDSPQQLVTALSKFFEDFEDMVIDAPHCASYISVMLASFVDRELLNDFKVLCVGEEHPLFESPAAADVTARAFAAVPADQRQFLFAKTFLDQPYSDLQKDMLKDALRKQQLGDLVV